MKEKDIRRLSLKNNSERIILKESLNYDITINDTKTTPKYSEYDLFFEFREPNISSDITFRVILERSTNISVRIIIKTPEGVSGVESQLDMRALILHPDASIQFVPSLEIDEMDVSVDHKSTIGTPSIDWLQYMYSRGIDHDSSIEILKSSFLKVE